MPVNKDALLRYHVIDLCLQNKSRKWTWDKLAQKCTDAVNEGTASFKTNIFSKRTIETDIVAMKSEALGYFAPIEKDKDGSFYYTDPHFSIRNCTLNENDLQHLKYAIDILKCYRGFGLVNGLEDVFQKLENKYLLKKQQNLASIVQFESTPLAEGLNWLAILIKKIIDKEPITISYQRFDSDIIKTHDVHPYFLKEYRGRWYLLGLNHKHNRLQTFALDRLQSVLPNTLQYFEKDKPNPQVFFQNTIGVSMVEKESIEVQLRFSVQQSKYILSQPIHTSQEIISQNETGLKVKINVVENYELLTTLLSFGKEVEVLSPASLRNSLIDILKQMIQQYNN